MPNWCANYISISGPKEKIAQLWGAMNEKQGLLEALCPIGEWDYNKAIAEWGTKWDINTEDLRVHEISDGRMEIFGSFDSAWSPPIEALNHYLIENNDCKASLDYFEPGMMFCGTYNETDGQEHYEIDQHDLDAIPDDIREQWNLDEWYEDQGEEE